PGFGKLIVDAVFNRDYAVVQGVVLFTATAYIVLNLLADLAYVVVNPQMRVDALAGPAEPVRISPRAHPFRRLLRRGAAAAGLVVIAIVVTVALFAPWIAPYDPLAASWSAIRKAPSAAHWFGTDEIGRYVLSRVIFGARA